VSKNPYTHITAEGIKAKGPTCLFSIGNIMPIKKFVVQLERLPKDMTTDRGGIKNNSRMK